MSHNFIGCSLTKRFTAVHCDAISKPDPVAHTRLYIHGQQETQDQPVPRPSLLSSPIRNVYYYLDIFYRSICCNTSKANTLPKTVKPQVMGNVYVLVTILSGCHCTVNKSFAFQSSLCESAEHEITTDTHQPQMPPLVLVHWAHIPVSHWAQS